DTGGFGCHTHRWQRRSRHAREERGGFTDRRCQTQLTTALESVMRYSIGRDLRLRFGGVGLADDLSVDAELDLFGDHQTARFQQLIPRQAPLGAVDLARGLRSETGVAPRVLHRTGDFGFEGDRVGDAAHGEVALYDEVITVTVDRRRFEGDVRVVLSIEEVGGAQVGVAVG